MVKLSTIKPYEHNPRRITAKAVEQTAKSIRDFGWQQPIVVDQDMVIVAGHVRYAAATELGLNTVPILVADGLSPAQVRAFRIADNRSHDYTTWDYTELVAELNGLGEEFGDVLDLTDWSALMQAFETAGQSANDQDLPDSADNVPISGTGFVLTVEFGNREDADRAGPTIMALPGVLNVRHANR